RPYSKYSDRFGASTGNDITAKLPSAHRDNSGGTRRIRNWTVEPAARKSKTVDQPSQPFTIAARYIKEWTDPGGSVLDFSCGSGTTGEACVRLYRNFTGLDIDPIKVGMSRTLLDSVKPMSLKKEEIEINNRI